MEERWIMVSWMLVNRLNWHNDIYPAKYIVIFLQIFLPKKKKAIVVTVIKMSYIYEQKVKWS